MNFKTLANASLKNPYVLGLTTASAIITLGLNNPPVLADTRVDTATSISKSIDDKKVPQTETVQVKRVIYFHLLHGAHKVEQVSYAHRQVLGDTVTKWKIDPFEDIEIPQQEHFKPSMTEIPSITETNDLSCFNHSIDIFYRPIKNEDKLPEEKHHENKDSGTQTDTQIKDEQVGTETIQSKDEAIQSQDVPLVDNATNTVERLTKDEITQSDSLGVDSSTSTEQIESVNQETQVDIPTIDRGVGNDEVALKEVGIGDESYIYKDQNTQTDNLIMPHVDVASMTDLIGTKELIDCGVGEDSINEPQQQESSITEDTQIESLDTDVSTETNPYMVKDDGTQTIHTTIDDETQTLGTEKIDKTTQTNSQELKNAATQTETVVVNDYIQTTKPQLRDQETETNNVNHKNQRVQTISNLTRDQESQTVTTAVDDSQQTESENKKEVGTSTTAVIKTDAETETDNNQKDSSTQTVDAYNQDQGDQRGLKNIGEPENELIAQQTADQPTIPRSNDENEPLEEDNYTKHRNILHNRISKDNESLRSLASLANKTNRNNMRQRKLPQTGNDTNTLISLVGGGITMLLAGMSLFSLSKQKKFKIK